MAILSLIAKLGLDGSGFQRGIQQAEKSIDSLSKKLGGAFAATAVTAAIGAVSKKTLDYAGQLEDLANRTGVGAEQLQEFAYAAEQNGSSLDTVASFLEKVNVSRQTALEGNEEMIKSFAALGVTVEDLKTTPVEELAKKIGSVVKDGNVAELIGDLRQIGGKGAGELVGAFKGGLEELGQEARNAGAVIDDELVAKLDSIGDKFTTIGKQIMAKMAPAIGFVADAIQAVIDQFGRVFAFFGGFSGGGMKGAKAALNDFDKQITAREQRNIENIQNRKDGRKQDFSKVENKEQKKESDKTEKEVERVNKSADEKNRKNFLSSLSEEKRLQELLKERKELLADMGENSFSPLAEADNNKKLADLEEEILNAGGKLESKVSRTDADSLAKIGGSIGGAVNFDPSLNVSKDQLAELKAIKRELVAIRSNRTPDDGGGFV